MGLLFWKDNQEIDAMAQAIADDLYSYVQPDVARHHIFATGKLKKKQAPKVAQKFTDVVLQMHRFGEAKSLGVYGKARMQKRFNDRLEELGYDANVVHKIAESMLLRNT
jgi:hypothetical protein